MRLPDRSPLVLGTATTTDPWFGRLLVATFASVQVAADGLRGRHTSCGGEGGGERGKGCLIRVV